MTATTPISTAGELNGKPVAPPLWGDSMRASIAAASGAIFALASTRCVLPGVLHGCSACFCCTINLQGQVFVV